MAAARARTISRLHVTVPDVPRLLLVEDDEGLARSLARRLGGFGFAVEHAGDPEAARAAVARGLPDLIVLDRFLPGLDGFALCRELKASPQTHFLPIIGISSDDSLEARLEAASAGFDHFQPKPVELRELVARARVLVETGAVLRATAAKTESLMLWHDWVRYIVHDLRNPVGIAIGNLAYALEEAPIAGGESLRALEEARYELERVTSMLQDILDTDRLTRGVLALERARVDLEGLGREVLKSTGVLLEARRIDLVLDAVGSCIVDGDPALLRRVLVNLMGNAIRYARSRVRLAFEGAPGAVRVSVENDGPGIPEALRARIFEPWIVLDPTGGVTQGTGLGLAFCRLVVAAHGGEIAVTSSAEGKVLFTVTLPI